MPISTVVLVLLGYGYSLAVESVFGIKAEYVGDSLADYLRLSGYVLMGFIDAVQAALFRLDTYVRAYQNFGGWFGVGLSRGSGWYFC